MLTAWGCSDQFRWAKGHSPLAFVLHSLLSAEMAMRRRRPAHFFRFTHSFATGGGSQRGVLVIARLYGVSHSTISRLT